MSLLRKAILVNSTAFICLGLGVLQAAVLSRVLGPARVGQYAVILSVLVLAGQLSSLGFPLSFLYHSQHDPANTKVYLINTIWSMLLMGAVGGVLLTVLIYYKTSYFGEVPWFALVAILFYVPILLQRCVARNNLLINIEARRLSLMDLSAMTGAVLAILVLAGLGLLGVGQAILCFVFAAIIRASLGWFWMRRNVDFSIKPSWRINWKLGLMGVRQSWMDLIILVNAQLNILIIKYLLDNFESVGYFSRGQRIAMLAVMAGQAVLPLLFSRWASFPEDKLAPHVEKVMRFASSVSIFMIAVILVGAKWIVLFIYGKEFLPAVTPTQILVPGTVLYLLSLVLIQLLASRGRPEYVVIVLMIAVVINAVLCWLVVPVWGIAGAACASTAANIVILVLLTLIVRKKYGIRVANCIGLNRGDIESIMTSLPKKALWWKR
jgi:O-antigen/teichoic acid export membrane protein